jgi:hypothetical protein
LGGPAPNRVAGFKITRDVPSIYEDAVMLIHAVNVMLIHAVKK